MTLDSPETQSRGSLHRIVGRHCHATLYLGDWKDVLPLAADAMITDQPYGTGWIRGGGKKAGDFKRLTETAEWDVFNLAWMEHAPKILAAFCPTQGVWEMCLRLKTPCVMKYRKSNPAPYVGIERDATHYATAVERIRQELDGALL